MPPSSDRENQDFSRINQMSKERIGQISTMIVQLGLRNGRNIIIAEIENLPKALSISGEELAEYLEAIDDDR